MVFGLLVAALALAGADPVNRRDETVELADIALAAGAPVLGAPASAAPPPDPRPAGAVDEDPPALPRPGWPSADSEPEVAGAAETPTPTAVAPVPSATTTPDPTTPANPTAVATAPTGPPAPTPTPLPEPPAPTPTTAATPPPPPTATPAPPPPDATARGQEALASIGYDWGGRLPGWTIAFVAQETGARGLTFTSEKRIEIYVRSGDSTWQIARVIAHELGHAVDLTHNSVGDRETWRTQRDIADLPWWPTSGGSDFASGAGDFAECFATWQVGAASLSTAGPCSQADLDLLASLS